LIIARGTASPVSVNAKLDVTGGSGTIISDNFSAGAGQTYSLATPTLGGGYQLSVRGGGNVTSGTSVFQTTGTAITLNGNASIAVLDNLSGQAASAFYSSSGITGTGDLTLKNNSSNSSSYITLATAAVNNTGSITNSGNGSGSVTISSVIGTNVTGITQNSATSALNLSGVNTYTGATTISAGTLTISSTGQLGSGTYAGNIANDGAFVYASSASQTLSGILSGAGALTKNGSSALTLTGANTYTGATIINTGTLQIGSGSTTGSLAAGSAITINSGTLAFNRSDSVVQGTDFSSAIVGSGTLAQKGSGALTLSGNNSGFSGVVRLETGTLNINSANALGTGTLTTSVNATINNTSGAAVTNLGNNAITLGDFLIFGDSNSTSANNLNLGTGTVSMSAGRTVTLAGTNTTLSMGALYISNNSTGRTLTANGANNTLVLGGLSLSQNPSAAANVTLSGNANITIDGAIVPGTAFAHGLVIASTGTTTFNGVNTYNGTTTLNAGGTLVLANSSALGGTANGTTVASGASLQLAGGITIGAEALSLSGNGTANNGALRNNSGDNTYNGNITLAAASRISSEAGSLTVGGNVTLASNTLTVATSAGNATFSGRISGTGSLVKDGAGTQVLSGNNTYTGTTTVNSGTLQANAANALGATSQVLMNNGGSFLVSASDSVSDNAAINLNGGTLAIGGGVGEVVGALTLSANSTIDMNGVGNTWISFASLTSVLDNSSRLEVWNYTPGSDAIYFQDQTNLASSLNYISFYSGAGTGTFYNALNTSSFSAPELYATVVPEPSTYIAAILLLCGLGVQFFRSRQNLGKRS
jgi:autotransporter-associated beta strand protein